MHLGMAKVGTSIILLALGLAAGLKLKHDLKRSNSSAGRPSGTTGGSCRAVCDTNNCFVLSSKYGGSPVSMWSVMLPNDHESAAHPSTVVPPAMDSGAL